MKKTNFQLILLLLLTIFSYSQTTPGEYTINNLDSNSKNSDFGPTLFGENKIIFSSSRGGILKKKWDNNQPFLDLYEGEIREDGSVINVKTLSSNVNSKYHESSVSFSPDNKTVYFTRNNKFNDDTNITIEVPSTRGERRRGGSQKTQDPNSMTYLAVYRADVDDNGKWINIEPLPFNNRNYSVGHPTVNRDGTKLYFTSDMPGAYGGTDIFVTEIHSDGTFSRPKNLGRKINTLGKEMFPYIDSKNILYFSSDSRRSGFGGLDIYAAKIYEKSISNALHIGTPINSEDDDFSYALNNITNEGYFSSNRNKGKGDDDIYHFSAIVPLNIECTQSVTGIVRNTKTNKPISNATVIVINELGEEQSSVKTSSKGKFKVDVHCDGSFKIIASKTDYVSDEKIFTTENNPDAKLDLNLNLEPIIVCNQNIKGTVKDSRTSKTIPNALVSLYDNDGNSISSTNTNSKGAFKFEAKCENTFKVVASKEKYESSEETFSTGRKSGAKVKLALRLKLKPDLTEVKIIRNKVIVNINPIYFELDKAKITKTAAKELDKVVMIMKKYPKLKIEGGSHTDSRGPDSYNLELSYRRADSTIKYIIRHGVNPNRIIAKGYGETQPVNRCSEGVRCSNDEHGQNRRTEFVILNPEVLGYIDE